MIFCLGVGLSWRRVLYYFLKKINIKRTGTFDNSERKIIKWLKAETLGEQKKSVGEGESETGKKERDELCFKISLKKSDFHFKKCSLWKGKIFEFYNIIANFSVYTFPYILLNKEFCWLKILIRFDIFKPE